MSPIKIISLLIILSVCLVSCKEAPVPVPKPRVYPRIDFPQHEYQAYSNDNCEYTFEYPTYAIIKQDKYQYGNQASNECWFNLEIPDLNAAIYCDYTNIENGNFGNLVQDAFKIVGKHNIKANFREENVIQTSENIGGLLFSIKGPVATPYQFFLTDTTAHFFRASLYFNSKVNPDSMKVVHDFVKEDIDHMIKTFNWK